MNANGPNQNMQYPINSKLEIRAAYRYCIPVRLPMDGDASPSEKWKLQMQGKRKWNRFLPAMKQCRQ